MTKVVIVTGAGKGMGAGILKRLAGEGYKVAAMSPSGAAKELAESLGGVGVTGSNAVPADTEALVKLTLDKFGRIDALVNNTGHPPKGPLLEISDEAWLQGFELVHLSVVRMLRLVTPVMLAQGKGAIVNLLTYATLEPEADFPVSGPVRAALAAFTKVYADQYAAQGIRINNLLPGFIDSLPEKDTRKARIPMGRYGKVEEIAGTVSFLLSDAAGYITGQNLRVDGGITRAL
ncbi:SDR family oxidoreductase [Ferrovibrio sp.]|uniref:SDR family oxidoreductase n=1 Tax=Ferrovibrio sp. TaxID=1917215 RepID=UPI001B4E24C5|nr:SDR family oxidoreductase [Ferrovibrio sp.]MBP7066459.1 SDR family oxidoreductase [Ferrovibrio sp.]